MSRLEHQRTDLVKLNTRVLSYRTDIDTLLRLYQIKPQDIAKVKGDDYRWGGYQGDISTEDPNYIPHELLRSAYNTILSRIGDMKVARESLAKLPNGNDRHGGLNKLKEIAVKTATVLSNHDCPEIHIGGDLHRLEYNTNGNIMNYLHYSIQIGPSWVRKVVRKDLSIQDIAGREAMVLDANQLPTTPEGYEAYATKVVTIRRPISRLKQIEVAKSWEEAHIPGKGTLVKYHDFKHPAFLRYETRYVVRTMTTDGWKSCTGTTVNWAASTLKRRMKTIMLRKLSV